MLLLWCVAATVTDDDGDDVDGGSAMVVVLFHMYYVSVFVSACGRKHTHTHTVIQQSVSVRKQMNTSNE